MLCQIQLLLSLSGDVTGEFTKASGFVCLCMSKLRY